MFKTITKSMFHDAFRDYDRLENFSFEGREALFEHLEGIETEENPIELDVIAICCDYSEDSIKDVLENYNMDSLEELAEETIIVWHDDKRVLYLDF